MQCVSFLICLDRIRFLLSKGDSDDEDPKSSDDSVNTSFPIQPRVSEYGGTPFRCQPSHNDCNPSLRWTPWSSTWSPPGPPELEMLVFFTTRARGRTSPGTRIQAMSGIAAGVRPWGLWGWKGRAGQRWKHPVPERAARHKGRGATQRPIRFGHSNKQTEPLKGIDTQKNTHGAWSPACCPSLGQGQASNRSMASMLRRWLG